MYKLTNGTTILRLADGASIPADGANRDYAEYLAWMAVEGNWPAPYEAPYVDPNTTILAEIRALEEAQLLPRVSREFMLLMLEAQFTSAQLAHNRGYTSLKAFDASITALRDKLV